MNDWFAALQQHWIWLSIGVTLGIVEILAPGFFLMWLGLAAILVGLLVWALPISLPLQVALFAIISVLSVYAGKRFLKTNPILSDDPALNDRGARLAGEIVTVVEAISNGTGRVKIGDSVWIARGADTAVGLTVRVTGADGAVLLVETV